MGEKIWIPIDDGGRMELPVEDPRAQAYLAENQRPSVYTVQHGDTLTSIAQRVYGNGSLWPQIASANKLQDPNMILIGQQLAVPLPSETFRPVVPPARPKPPAAAASNGSTPAPTNGGGGSTNNGGGSYRMPLPAPTQPTPSFLPASLAPARGFMFVVFEQLPEVGAGGKIIRKVAAIPHDYGVIPGTRFIVPMPGVGQILPANPAGLITPVEHVMNLDPKNSQFLSASDRPMGSGSIDGKPLLMDVPKITAAGGRVITVPQLVSDLTQFGIKNPASRIQMDRLIWTISQIEGEVLVTGGVPHGASTVPSTPHMQYIESAETLWQAFKKNNLSQVELEQALLQLEKSYARAKVFGRVGRVLFILGVVVTAVDLGLAARQSIRQDSIKPISAEVIRQAGGWGGAAAGAKIGFLIGAACGIETGPGAIATGAVGAIVFGAAGYFGADWVADQISEN